MTEYTSIAKLNTLQTFKNYLSNMNIDLCLDDELVGGAQAIFSQPYLLPDGFTIGNRFCVHPMEGWDGTFDGKPTDLTRRRWINFGKSGAKLIWGGEAVAVCYEGRANPNQLQINKENLPALTALHQEIIKTHELYHGDTSDLLIGLQLTHSGRFSRPDPDNRPKPVIAYHHPYLDKKVNINNDYPIIRDDEIDNLTMKFIEAAGMAAQAGFNFVDIKHCHGYLGHELLSARERQGPYGGSFENRTRFLRQIVAGIRQKTPQMRIGVRLSAFDFIAFEPDPQTKVGQPVSYQAYPQPFGAKASDPLTIDLTETIKFLELLEELGITMVNITGGSPYYNPHIQRPALHPPSDGYIPPEDPLIGVTRHIKVCSALKQHFPHMLIVGTAYSYLQEWLPNVAQYYLRTGQVDFIGLGRLMLSYPEYPSCILRQQPVKRQCLCRTFSDCTTAPRIGLVSGCYPLDPVYKRMPQHQQLLEFKAKKKNKTAKYN